MANLNWHTQRGKESRNVTLFVYFFASLFSESLKAPSVFLLVVMLQSYTKNVLFDFIIIIVFIICTDSPKNNILLLLTHPYVVP